MKIHPTFFGVAIATVIVVSLGILFVNYSRWVPTRGTPTNATISQTLPESQSAASSLLVTPIASRVSIAPLTNVSNFQSIASPTQATEGSRVKTDATGRALIEGTNTTVIDSNTEIVLTTLDTQKNQTRLQLEAGQVWSRVKKLSDKGEFYEIETQQARASVRGTSFGMKRVGKMLTLYVTEGVVRFGSIAPQDDTSIRYSDANVRAGQKAVLSDGDFVPTVSDLTDADKNDPWFIYNNSSTSRNVSSTLEFPPKDSDTGPATQPIVPRVFEDETIPSNATSTNEQRTTTPESSTNTSNASISPATPESPELLLSSVSPNKFAARTGGTLTLKGFGFQKASVFSVFIGNARLTSFSIVNDSSISLSIPANQFEPGTYDVTVEGSGEISSTLTQGLVITSQP